MSKRSPEDLDKLFQQEPEQYPFPYNEASWTEMEKLLDKDDHRRFLWWWFFGFGGLILIGSIFFFGKSETNVVDANLNFDQKEIVENQSTNSEIQTLESPGLKEEDNSNIILNKNGSNNSNILEEFNPNYNTQQNIYKKQESQLEQSSDDVVFSKVENSNHSLIDSFGVKENTFDTELLLEKKKAVSSKIDSVNTLLNSSLVTPIASLEIFLSKEKMLLEIPFLEKRENDVKTTLPSKNKNKVLFGVLVGAESTGVNINNFSQLNWKVGAQLEYRFFNRFSASIGANFIKKRYGAKGSDYQPDDGSWLYDVSPQTVDAVCDILEVPINIGFFQKGYNKNGFYSKLGFSSFFMLEEHYWYSYEIQVPGQIKYWRGYNENRHWFGIGEIYVGYQQVLSPITTMQIEPYFQIPLAGVGNGKVELWSVGMNVKLNFQAN